MSFTIGYFTKRFVFPYKTCNLILINIQYFTIIEDILDLKKKLPQ